MSSKAIKQARGDTDGQEIFKGCPLEYVHDIKSLKKFITVRPEKLKLLAYFPGDDLKYFNELRDHLVEAYGILMDHKPTLNMDIAVIKCDPDSAALKILEEKENILCLPHCRLYRDMEQLDSFSGSDFVQFLLGVRCIQDGSAHFKAQILNTDVKDTTSTASFEITMTRGLDFLPLILDSKLLVVKGKLVMGNENATNLNLGSYNGTPVTIKTIKHDVYKTDDENKEWSNRFFDDVCEINDLRHVNITELQGVVLSKSSATAVSKSSGKADGVTWRLLFPYFPRGSLSVYLTNYTKLTEGRQEDDLQIERIHIALGIARGLAFMHSKNKAHTNLTTDNVLLMKTENELVPKIWDFELTKQISPSVGYFGKQTGDSQYDAPEVLRGKITPKHSIDAKTNSIEKVNRKSGKDETGQDADDDDDESLSPNTFLSSDVYSFALIAIQIIANQFDLNKVVVYSKTNPGRVTVYGEALSNEQRYDAMVNSEYESRECKFITEDKEKGRNTEPGVLQEKLCRNDKQRYYAGSRENEKNSTLRRDILCGKLHKSVGLDTFETILKCLSFDPDCRPTMNEVVEKLQSELQPNSNIHTDRVTAAYNSQKNASAAAKQSKSVKQGMRDNRSHHYYNPDQYQHRDPENILPETPEYRAPRDAAGQRIKRSVAGQGPRR